LYNNKIFKKSTYLLLEVDKLKKTKLNKLGVINTNKERYSLIEKEKADL
jgi:hypothetical protein